MTQKEINNVIAEDKDIIINQLENGITVEELAKDYDINLKKFNIGLIKNKISYENILKNNEERDKTISFLSQNYDTLIKYLIEGVPVASVASSLNMSENELNKMLVPYGVILKGVKNPNHYIQKDKNKGSKGEQAIRRILTEYNKNFKEQYTFDNCVFQDTSAKARFDFAVFDEYDNLSYLIEYDGEQHYKAVKMWGGEEGLQKRKEHDAFKNNYCYINNIPLIRIPYDVDLDILELEDLIPETSWYLI